MATSDSPYRYERLKELVERHTPIDIESAITILRDTRGKSDSDITLGDLWGAEQICPEMDDDKGLSLVMMRKEQELPKSDRIEIPYNEALKYNPSISTNVAMPHKRSKFFRLAHKSGVCKATQTCTTQSKFEIIWRKIVWNIKNRILK
jgi:hypothetical protein